MTDDGAATAAARSEATDPDDPDVFAAAGRLAAARLAAMRVQGSSQDIESLTRALGIVALRFAAEFGANDPRALAMAAEAVAAELDTARLSGSQTRVRAAAERLKALADSMDRVADRPALQIGVAANAAIADFEVARASGSSSAMEQAARSLRLVGARATELLGGEHDVSVAIAVNAAVARYEAARAVGSLVLLDAARRELAQLSDRLDRTLGDNHPYSVVIGAYLRDSRSLDTASRFPASEYVSWGQGASTAIRRSHPRPRRDPDADASVSLVRILEHHPDIVHLGGPTPTLIKRDELLVLDRHADAVHDAARRWIDGRQDFAELGVVKLLLRRNAGIDAAQLVDDLRGGPDAYRRLSVVPNHILRIEPAFAGDASTGPRTAGPLPRPAIRSGGRRVVVGILDTGLDPHPWFVGTEWFAEHGTDDLEPAIDPDGWSTAGAAEVGHGTFVAGIVMQQAPTAYLSMERAVRSDGLVDELGLVAALHRIRQRAALANNSLDVLNLSLGCYTFDDRPSPVLADAVARLSRHTVVVAAAGNSAAARPFWPAALKDTVAVAALAEPGGPGRPERADFSNYGWWVDAAAPGQDVVSTFLDDGYATWSGTSFAAPYVVGRIAALMVSKDVNAFDAVCELLDPASGERAPDLGVRVSPH